MAGLAVWLGSWGVCGATCAHHLTLPFIWPSFARAHCAYALLHPRRPLPRLFVSGEPGDDESAARLQQRVRALLAQLAGATEEVAAARAELRVWKVVPREPHPPSTFSFSIRVSLSGLRQGHSQPSDGRMV